MLILVLEDLADATINHVKILILIFFYRLIFRLTVINAHPGLQVVHITTIMIMLVLAPSVLRRLYFLQGGEGL